MKKLFAIVLFAFVFVSCKKSGGDALLDASIAADIRNVPYGTEALQNMDVYLPPNRSATTTNCVIIIHGGSWSGGDKADMDSAITAMKPLLANYATFNINYRLAATNNNIHPTQSNDVNAAINFIVSKANEYQINANKMVIVGASAGAHLGMLKAYKENTDGRIKAIVDLFGPNDLTWMYISHPLPAFSQSVLINYLGVTQPANPTLYQQASPINFVTSTAPPTQIFHGTADQVVPISESQRLQTKLQSLGVTNQYHTYTGAGHGDWSTTIWADVFLKASNFIKTYIP